MNVFDFVFVVALASSLANTILSPDATLADGVLTLATMIGLQILLSWQGLASLETVESLVLETDDTFSVVWRKSEISFSSMSDVPDHPAARPNEGSD